jgi:hypothetical protein
MSKVIADISMSLDGYVTARGADQEHSPGIGGEAIHAWVLEEPRSPVDEAVLGRSFEQTGAVVMGRRLFDLVGPTTLVQREVINSPRATHLTYEVVRD